MPKVIYNLFVPENDEINIEAIKDAIKKKYDDPDKAQAVIGWLEDPDNYYFLDKSRKSQITSEFLRNIKGIDRQALSELDNYIPADSDELDDRTKLGRQVVNHYFSQAYVREFMNDGGYVAILNGSLLYNDPGKEFDADTVVFYDRMPDKGESITHIRYSNAFAEEWEKTTKSYAESINFVNLQSVDLDNLYDNLKRQPEGIYLLMGQLSRIVTGRPILESQQEKFKELREKAIGLIESDPLLTAMVNADIKDTLQTRKEKRA